MKAIKVTSVRYFETPRGLGYQVKTNCGTIWNDGDGGETYFLDSEGRYVNEINGLKGMERERYLESLITEHEISKLVNKQN